MKRYYIQLEELDGLDAISFVETPAIEAPALCFSDAQRFEFSEEQMVVTGPALIPDMPIYRNDPKLGEYEVVFKPEVIRELAIRDFRDNKKNLFDLEHSTDITSDDVTMFESYFTDANKKFKNLPNGSWIISYKVNNQEVWNYIKQSPSSAGFSVEVRANLSEEPTNLVEEQTLEELIDEILGFEPNQHGKEV